MEKDGSFKGEVKAILKFLERGQIELLDCLREAKASLRNLL